MPQTSSPQMPRDLSQATSTATRIRALQELQNMSVADLVRATGLTHSRITMMYQRDTEPRREALHLFAKALGVSPEFLRTGLTRPGEQLPASLDAVRKDTNASYKADIGALVPAEDLPDAPVYRLPMPAAGTGALAFGEEPVGLKHIDPSIYERAPRGIVCAYADGKSMEPTIQDGAMLIIALQPDLPPRPGVYVVRVDQELLCKRVAYEMGTLHLISDNTDYPNRLFTQDEAAEVEIVGRVLSQQSEVV